jgi:hypothetical protein
MNDPVKMIATEIERLLQPLAERRLGVSVMGPDRMETEKDRD